MKEPEPGRLLVSEPFLNDQYFRRSVVLLSEHNDNGTTGFILNKPTQIKLNQALEDFPEFNAQIFFGGPVQTDSLHYLHRLGNKLPESKEIIPGIFWGGDFEILKLLIDAKEITPDQIRFFVGYSGWAPKQLANEIKIKSWILAQASPKFTFFDKPGNLWADVLRSLGKEFSIIANFPEDPAMN